MAGGLFLALCGRLVGIEELYVLATAAVVLVVAAAVQVHASPPQLDATRTLHPARVHAGRDSRVELAVRNAGHRPTPVLAVLDRFDRTRREARFLLAPLGPGEVARAAYRLPTEQRGVFTLGPLEIVRSDAFGLASRTVHLAGATQLVVYPHVDVVAPVPNNAGHDPYAGADHPNPLGLGDDFYGLRPYEVGDDLRRVHWPSTARTGELMIRQDQMPWQGRSTVLLDVRRGAHTPASLELAVSAAASIVSAAWQRRSLVRLVTTDGVDSGSAAGVGHVEAIMEHLAVVRSTPRDRLSEVLDALRRSGRGGGLAIVAGALGDADLQALARLRGRFGSAVVVLTEATTAAGAPGRQARQRAAPRGMIVVQVNEDAPFPEAWNRAIGTSTPRAGARR